MSFEFLDPADASSNHDTIYNQEYECFISPYYNDETLYPGVYAQASQTYYPMWYTNKTDGISEVFCVGVNDYIDTDICD